MPKMEYVGPGSEADPRVITVSDSEAEALAERGLWKPKAARQPVKKAESKTKEKSDA